MDKTYWLAGDELASIMDDLRIGAFNMASVLILIIYLISKPEMTLPEMVEIVKSDFPGFAGGFSLDATAWTIRLQLPQVDLTVQQRDWLHISSFAARYVDSYKVHPPVAELETEATNMTVIEIHGTCPAPAFAFFEKVYRKGQTVWSAVMGMKYDAVDERGEAWFYLLDTDEDWIIESDLDTF